MKRPDGQGTQTILYLALLLVEFAAWWGLCLMFHRKWITFDFGWTNPFIWLGWFSSLLIALGRLRGRHSGQVPCLELLLPIFMLDTGIWQSLMLKRLDHGPAVDEFLLAFGRNYGHIAFRVGEWLSLCPRVVRTLLEWVYFGSILPLVFVYLSLSPETKTRRRLWLSFALIGICGVLFYQICPAAGPAYAFPEQFPFHVPILQSPQARSLPHALLNAVPSLHLAIALLTVIYARYCAKPILIGAVAFLILTVLATLGLGEHYLIDLIVAVPFVVGIDSLPGVLHSRGSRITAYSCLVLVLAWELALRGGMALHLSPPVAWILSVLTVLIPFLPTDLHRWHAPSITAWSDSKARGSV